jgi:hypothetical protein
MLAGLRYVRAIADNIAPTLTITVAIGAAGLAITSRTHGTPYWIGVAVAVIGGLGAILTLGVALARTVKTREFRDALGRAFEAGEDLFDEPEWSLVTPWVNDTYELILAGLGESEAQLFLSNHDLGLVQAPVHDKSPQRSLERRLQRLSRLLDRAYAVHVGVDFDTKRAVALFPRPAY